MELFLFVIFLSLAITVAAIGLVLLFIIGIIRIFFPVLYRNLKMQLFPPKMRICIK